MAIIDPTKRKTIALVGMMGVGKSTSGWRIAEKLGIDFVDSDKEIEAYEGRTVTQIFRVKGEKYFYEAERKIIQEILSRDNYQVLSCGGETFKDDTNRQLIKDNAISVWLKADIDTLVSRVSKRRNRPLLENGKDKKETLEELIREGERLYSQADLHVDTTSGAREEILNDVIKKVLSHISGGNK